LTRIAAANQFRALEEDEIMFLDSVREKEEEEERQRKLKDGEEIMNFRQCGTLHFLGTFTTFILLQSRGSANERTQQCPTAKQP
jgi:hypothetical protein